MEKALKDAYFCVKRNQDIKIIYAKRYHDRVNEVADFQKGTKV